MRLSENIVVQEVGGRYVVVDDTSGEEVVMSAVEFARLGIGALGYFAAHDPALGEAMATEIERAGLAT